MNLDDVAVAIGNACTTNVTGIRKAFDHVPDKITPDAVIVALGEGSFDEDFDGGQTVNWAVLVVVSRTNPATAQSKLRNYCRTSGPTSVKAGIESDQTLAGTVGSVHVKGWDQPEQVTIGGNEYAAIPFIVETID